MRMRAAAKSTRARFGWITYYLAMLSLIAWSWHLRWAPLPGWLALWLRFDLIFVALAMAFGLYLEARELVRKRPEP